MKSILLTNDDGVEAEGLIVLKEELSKIAHVMVVSPDRDNSAISHSLSNRRQFRFEDVRPDTYSLNGTPVECVIYALDKLFVNPPDLVISGINHGANLGDHIMYSGTVAAAREAAKHGLAAMAVSQDYEEGKKVKFKKGAEFIRNMVTTMLHTGLNGELLFNINIPMGKINGLKITRQGVSRHLRHFDEDDNDLYIPGSDCFSRDDLPSDRLAILENYVSLTPLQRDQTDYYSARRLMFESAQLLG